MKLINKLFITLLLIHLLAGCKSELREADISKIELKPVKFLRLDKDLFSITAENLEQKQKELELKYGKFFQQFVFSIVNANKTDTNFLLQFVTDKDMKGAYEAVQKTISDKDIEVLEKELTDSEKRFKYFFPKRKLPHEHIAYFSGFNYNIVYPDSTLGISLEMYLGSNNSYYKMLQWPLYQTRTMSKEYMLSNLMRGWIITEFDNSESVNNLLSHMMFYGKIFYTCQVLMPQIQDSILIGYSTTQMNYCQKYEKNLWGFFAQDNRLYENNLKTISEFTSEGPFTASISKECPPRIAMWIGWQIIKSHMKNNPEKTLDQLMKENDAQKLLNKSKYRP